MSQRLLVLLSLLVLSLMALGLRPYVYPVEVQRDTGLTGQARVNDWLAAERFLRRMGVPSERLRSSEWEDQLPYTEGVLMVEPTGTEMEPARLDTLRDWVANGGHLIVALNPDVKCSDDEPHWVDEFMTKLVSDVSCNRGLDLDLGLGLNLNKLLKTEEMNPPEPADIEIDGAKLSITLKNFPRLRVKATADAEVIARDELGACIVQGTFDYGLVTLLCDTDLFYSLALPDEDRAELLFRLVAQTRPRESSDMLSGWTVWLDHWGPRWDATPSLPVWLWRKAPVAVALAGFALGLGLWAASRRLGPRIGLATPGRREIMEHVEACGRFAWRSRAEKPMLDGLNASLEEVLKVRVPGWSHVPAEERPARLAALSGLEEARIRAAIDPPTEARAVRKQFPAIVRTLERLRRML